MLIFTHAKGFGEFRQYTVEPLKTATLWGMKKWPFYRGGRLIEVILLRILNKMFIWGMIKPLTATFRVAVWRGSTVSLKSIFKYVHEMICGFSPIPLHD